MTPNTRVALARWILRAAAELAQVDFYAMDARDARRKTCPRDAAHNAASEKRWEMDSGRASFWCERKTGFEGRCVSARRRHAAADSFTVRGQRSSLDVSAIPRARAVVLGEKGKWWAIAANEF